MYSRSWLSSACTARLWRDVCEWSPLLSSVKWRDACECAGEFANNCMRTCATQVSSACEDDACECAIVLARKPLRNTAGAPAPNSNVLHETHATLSKRPKTNLQQSAANFAALCLRLRIFAIQLLSSWGGGLQLLQLGRRKKSWLEQKRQRQKNMRTRDKCLC